MTYRLDDGQIEVLDPLRVAVLRAMTPGERMNLAAEAWTFAREWIAAAVRSQHPDWDPSAVEPEVSRRLLGEPAGSRAGRPAEARTPPRCDSDPGVS
ncbi:MAG TPA: hypothetical protein VM695_16145 [Phycisphaerae bacterium]|nr:hypothetical protein [Phycisphaerae bacterium]